MGWGWGGSDIMVEEGQKDQGPEVVTDYKEISSRYNKEAAL